LHLFNTLKKNYSYKNNTRIFGKIKSSETQKKEFINRRKVAKSYYKNFYSHISDHHSIQVMDLEIVNLLKKIPANSIICDIGGCWGWHWRNIDKQRPDIKIVIIDFVYENLLIAKRILKKKINNQIYLVNDDICNLKIEKEIFDTVWTVQTLQHIRKYSEAIKKIYKIIKKGGYLYNYNLNINYVAMIIYKIFNKKYLIKGYNNNFYLERSNKNQKNIIKKIFKNKIITRYTELLFHPDLKIKTGSIDNLFGKIDSLLSGHFFIKKILARQEAFIVKK
jgi:ubiquinone/menaquinone biosynthesis C-methylase UbiE